MGAYRQRNFGLFDPNRPLVAGRQMVLAGKQLHGGDPIDTQAVDTEIRRRLWMTEWAHYADDYTPTPELSTQGEGREWMDEADGVTVTEGENGWYTITAPWLGEEGEKVHGAEAAQARAAELRETGDTKGVEYAHSGGGWYEVKAPWLEEPIKVKGEEAAKAKAVELREQAPPPAPPTTPPVGEGGGEGGEDTGTGE